MNLDKMLFKLFIYPILLLVGSLVVPYILNTTIPNLFTPSTLLSGIGTQTKSLAPMVGLILLSASILRGLFSSFELWQWFNGSGGETCDNCGGMAVVPSKRSLWPIF